MDSTSSHPTRCFISFAASRKSWSDGTDCCVRSVILSLKWRIRLSRLCSIIAETRLRINLIPICSISSSDLCSAMEMKRKPMI